MGIEIAFQSKELRAICESPAKAKRELGDVASRVLRIRLADMGAADTVAELFDMGLEVEDCTQDPGLLVFRLDEEVILVCQVNHRNIPMNGSVVDWSLVTRLQVIRIGVDS